MRGVEVLTVHSSHVLGEWALPDGTDSRRAVLAQMLPPESLSASPLVPLTLGAAIGAGCDDTAAARQQMDLLLPSGLPSSASDLSR